MLAITPPEEQNIPVEVDREFAPRPGIGDVCRSVATRFKVSPAELRGQSRVRKFALPRQMAMFISREVTGLSLPKIGRYFDRDHTTILHACRTTAARLQKHSGLMEHYVAICADIQTTPTWKSTIRSEKDAAMAVGLFIHALGVRDGA